MLPLVLLRSLKLKELFGRWAWQTQVLKWERALGLAADFSVSPWAWENGRCDSLNLEAALLLCVLGKDTRVSTLIGLWDRSGRSNSSCFLKLPF